MTATLRRHCRKAEAMEFARPLGGETRRADPFAVGKTP
jgi:hypothetical protein